MKYGLGQKMVLFRGDPTMKSMTPFRFSLSTNHIETIGGDDSFWLGGQLVHLQSGVTYIDIDREIADNYMFNKTINMDETSIFSILELKKKYGSG